MSKFGGGGVKCTVCDKTAYPAETVMFEKKPYHSDCFRCCIETCNKKISAGNAAGYEDKIYCNHCFDKGGFAQKQRNVKWVKKEGSGSAVASKFGGGGTPCKICSKTVYPAETISYEKQTYHAECFKCSDCGKKISTTSNAASFEDNLVCRKCFAENGYTQKQTSQSKQNWVAKESSGVASKFGGGGQKCTVCDKTVYAAETVSYEKKAYHAACFACTVCSKKITPSSAALFEEKIICTKCFGEGGYRQKQVSSKTTHSSGGADPRFAKFGGGGTMCHICTKTVYSAELVSLEKFSFHADCVKCQHPDCGKKLSAAKVSQKLHKDADGKVVNIDIYCQQCFQSLGLHRADHA